MQLFISNLILLAGWQRLGLAFAAGALASLGQAPLGWFPILWLSLPLLIWLMDSASLAKRGRSAFWSMARVGWMFGFGFFLLTFYWLGAAFLVEADKFAWAMPLAVLVLPAGLALFWAVACGLCSLVWSASPLRILWLALALSAVEWLRGFVLTGLPWGGFGMVLGSNDITMQTLSLVGPDGLTLIALLVFALPALWFSNRDAAAPRLGRILSLLVGLLFVGQLGYGTYRLSLTGKESALQPVARLVQPNIPQKEKWKFENRAWIFNKLLALTTIDGEETPLKSVNLVLWPESSLPFFLMEQPGALAAISQSLPEGVDLLTGALRREPGQDAGIGHGDSVYNSIYHLNADGTILDSYDKVHLVPFGEFLPKQTWLEAIGLEQLTAQKSGFKAGSKRSLLTIERWGNLLPVICYEAAFSSELLRYPDGADWILNVTNDAWFGATSGPWQHLQLARMRAVETGLPVIRVANTGISAIIDGRGQLIAQLSLEQEGILQAKLPSKLTKTPYARLGSVVFLGIWVILFLTTVGIGRKPNIP
ncbi:apolipoprotein N-acyltransferase [Cohaesibacter sp. CAU 1516]|uniref:apolipoprotein N-acyltransferase n=1 Tax=Cohaesibacter sp. CAU 1516 TaxID=2576038 RepID=UPI0010FE9469|nr:apolipoprotein N-acyltransferase [Cohaesibacter sp. CAU 1516]TLP47196.1 apolipoprotein N-acyltransferase [Cohaesibacter sp. CAU 1516]